MSSIAPESEEISVLSTEDRLARLESMLEAADLPKQQQDSMTIVVFNGDMDKLMAAFILATGGAAMGIKTSMFFTYWGLVALKKKTLLRGKNLPHKLMSMMLPSGPNAVASSRFNMFGLGPKFFNYMMKKHNVQSLGDNIEMAQDLGVRMVACQMSMELMGITREELLDGIDFGGVATYLADAADSRITLFV